MVDRIRGFLDKPASTVKYYTGFNPIPDRNGKDDPAGEGKDKETNFDKEPVDTSSEDVDFLNDPSSLDDVDEDYEDPDDNSYDSSDFGTELTGSTGGNSAASHGGSAGDPPSNEAVPLAILTLVLIQKPQMMLTLKSLT
ncbi:hypothetical protein L0F63_004304 [Massospora cicadina]|nr:hypothetical protein L0F63_004304 [Massospora cicadina]